MKQHVTIRYGKPTDTSKPYIQEFYCAMHNGIPVKQWGEHTAFAPIDIDQLYPMQVVEQQLGQPGQKVVNIMICRKCVAYMRDQMTNQMKYPLEKAKQILREMREAGERNLQKDDDDEDLPRPPDLGWPSPA